MNDEELLNYLFNVKLILSFNDLYKKLKRAIQVLKKYLLKNCLISNKGYK